jgi:predicted ArsR family transcriptional regulator
VRSPNPPGRPAAEITAERRERIIELRYRSDPPNTYIQIAKIVGVSRDTVIRHLKLHKAEMAAAAEMAKESAV